MRGRFANLTAGLQDVGKAAQAALAPTNSSGKREPFWAKSAGPDADDDDDIWTIGGDEDLEPLWEDLDFIASAPSSSDCGSMSNRSCQSELPTTIPGMQDEGVGRSSSSASSLTAPAPSSAATGAALPGPVFDRSQQGSGPILAMVVVDFHHLVGPIVEWANPADVLLPEEQRNAMAPMLDGFPALDPWRSQEALPEAKELAEALGKAFASLPQLALPDGGHQDEASYVFFILPWQHGLLYGMSCYCQISAKELLHRGAEVSRSAVQKAVCVLSRCPFYGVIQQRIMPVMQAWFQQRDFRNTDILVGFHEQLNSVSFERLPESELFHGLDHTPLFRGLKISLLLVLKALMLEKKVAVFSPSPEACSRTVLNLLSLLPGGLWLSFNSNGFGARHFQFRKYALPLEIFGAHCHVYPYIGLQLVDVLAGLDGFLIGTTNPMVLDKAQPDVVIEVPPSVIPSAPLSTSALDGRAQDIKFTVLVSKELRQVIDPTKEEGKWLAEGLKRVKEAAQVGPKETFSTRMAAFRDAAARTAAATAAATEKAARMTAEATNQAAEKLMKAANNSPGTEETQKSSAAEVSEEAGLTENESHAAEAEAEAAEVPAAGGADSFAAGQEEVAADGSGALPDQMAGDGGEPGGSPKQAQASDWAAQALLQETSWAAQVDASRASFLQYWEKMLEKVAYLSGSERNFVSAFEALGRTEKAEVAMHGVDFLQHWLLGTHNGRRWMASHSLPVPTVKPKPPKQGEGEYTFPNGDVYKGEFKRGCRHGTGTYGSKKRGITFQGQWRKDKRSGQGTLTIKSRREEVKYTYEGQWLDDLRHGQGACTMANGTHYKGSWAKNAYHGSGCLVDSKGVAYEGEFCEGKYHGVGKMTTNQEIYTGDFQDGMRHGMGQLQYDPATAFRDPHLGVECIYAGMWNMDQRHGDGKMMYENAEYDGGWMADKRHGTAILTHAGHQLEGKWKQDSIDATGSHLLSYPGGTKYTGLLKRRVQPLTDEETKEATTAQSWPCLDQGGPGPYYWLVPDGQGVMKAPDGQMFDGEFRSGRPHGKGIFIDSSHVNHEGIFGQDLLPSNEKRQMELAVDSVPATPPSASIPAAPAPASVAAPVAAPAPVPPAAAFAPPARAPSAPSPPAPPPPAPSAPSAPPAPPAPSPVPSAVSPDPPAAPAAAGAPPPPPAPPAPATSPTSPSPPPATIDQASAADQHTVAESASTKESQG
mmetsp:Transcript_38111/g.89294  ORF Transcript_38111/g.89294 Transcript_38111/m.89294 type:complete len:1214 (+) Transcript_38111:74-3715(+)